VVRQKNCPSQIFALKTVRKDDIKNEIISVHKEVKLLSECDQPNIIKFYELFESSRMYYFQLEYCNGQNLRRYIKQRGNLLEPKLKLIFRQVLLAINHMHFRGICHRDIKPENFMFKNSYDINSLKLLDFGFAKRFFGQNGKSRMYNIIGTPTYVAPEVLSGDYDEKCDIWSAGVLLYKMATGYFPYDLNVEIEDLYKQIMAMQIDYKLKFKETNLSEEFFDLLKRLLCSEKKRISVNQALAHPWFDKAEVGTLESFQVNDMIKNFFEFKNYTPFQKNIFKVHVKWLSKMEVKSLQILFHQIDRDMDGVISFPELKYYLVQKGLFTTNQHCILNIQSLHQTDNHHIFYTEFLAAVIDKSMILSKEILKDIFNKIKLNTESGLSYKSIQNIYLLAGYTFDRTTFELLLQKHEIDPGAKKYFSFDDFEKLMTEDLKTITADKKELDQMLIKEIGSKKIRNSWNEFAIQV
jgi:calcium-dependent protein kinase